MSLTEYYRSFFQLLIVPFDHLGRAWPILPLYTSLILGELYKKRVGFSHAVGNGFVMVWAGFSWATHLSQVSFIHFQTLPWIVTACSIGLGVFTIILGLRKKDKALCEVLGHTRFSCYFLITLYPMQATLVAWNWPRMAAVLVFAIPCWFVIYILGRVGSRWVG